MAQKAAKKCDFSCNEVAVLYCKGCNQCLCVNCRQNVHEKVPLFKDHEVVNIEKEGNRVFRPHPVCDIHKKPFIYYCSRCDCLTCTECMSSSHNEHKTVKIKTVADDCRENVKQIIEDLKTKVVIVKEKLSTIETKHACQIKTDCELYVKRGEDTTSELHSIIDRHKHISNTKASDFQYNENQILDGKRTFFKQHYNETADRLLKFENLLLETHDSTFLTEWKALQIEVQIIKEETDDPLLDPTGIELFNQDVFIKSVIEEIDQQFQMRLKNQEEAVSNLTKELEVLTGDLKRKQDQIDDQSKLSGQLKEKEREVTDLSDENKILKTEIKRRHQTELSQVKDQEKTVTSLRDEIGQLKGELKGKQDQIDDLSKLSGQLKEKVTEVIELSDEKENLKTELKRREQKELSQLKDQEKTVTSFKDEIGQLKGELKGKQDQIDDLSKLSGQLKEKVTEVIELSDEKENLKTELKRREQKELSQLKDQEKTVTSFKDEIGQLKGELKGKQDQIDDLSKLSGQLKEKVTEVIELSDEKENLKTELKRREQKELSQLKDQEKTVTSFKDEIGQLKGELKGKQDQIDDLSKLSGQLKEKVTEVIELSDEKENLKTELKRREQKELSQLKDQEKTVTGFKGKIDQLKEELKGKQDQIDDLSKLSGQLKEKEKEVNKLSDENDNLRTEIKRRKQKALSQLKDQEKTVIRFKDEIGQLKGTLKEKKDQIDDLSKLKENEKQVNELQAENAKLKTDIQFKQDKIENIIKENTVGRPDKPYVSEKVNKSNQVILKWIYDGELKEEECYQIVMKQHPGGKWKVFQTPKPCINSIVTVDGLKGITSYVFKVCIANFLGKKGPFSPESDVITTEKSLAFKIMMRSELIDDCHPKVYRLPIREITQARNETSKTRKFILGTPRNDTNEKTILMIGATGSGKSTLINGMANYILGVKWEDPFRFTLIHSETCDQNQVGNEALSQTEWITCYTICQDVASQIDYTINVIDTPGFGNKCGLERYPQIVSRIRDLFTETDEKGVATLDAVCFILKAPDAILTTVQQYICELVLAYFGNDIKNKICTLVTFADCQRPPVLAALEALDETPLPFDIFFPFNNSALFVGNTAENQESLSPVFWEMGMKSYRAFLIGLNKLQTKSILHTSEVLANKQKLENNILHLQEEIDFGLSKINVLELQVNIFTKYKQEIQGNENFEYDVEESQMEKVDISGDGKHTTICLICNFTCHNNCAYANDNDKSKCCAMGGEGNCTVCPRNCNWKEHSNVPYVFKWYTRKVKRTYSEMRAKYQQAYHKKMSQEDVLRELRKEIEILETCIQVLVEEVTGYCNRLKEKNLRQDPLSTVEFIELRIESEMREKKLGFNQRVKILEQCKKPDELRARASLNASSAADGSSSAIKEIKDKFKNLIFG